MPTHQHQQGQPLMRAVSFARLVLCLLLLIGAMPQQAQAVTKSENQPASTSWMKLSDSFASGSHGIAAFQISPDGQHVVYIADQDTPDVYELYSVRFAGGKSVKLNDQLVAGGDVDASSHSFQDMFLISPDSKYVIYRADQKIDEQYELWSVPINGGVVQRLNPKLDADTDVLGPSTYRISLDGQQVVYVVGTPRAQTDIYSAPTSGGSPTKLSPAGASGATFEFIPSSNDIVACCDFIQDSNDGLALYRVPIAGGSANRISNHQHRVYAISRFHLTPDGNQVVYIASESSNNESKMYRTSSQGGDTQLLANESSPNFSISADGKHVVYRSWSRFSWELHQVPVNGGEIITLNEPKPSIVNEGVSTYLIAPGDKYVLYTTDEFNGGKPELYSVPITGGTRHKLNPDLGEDGGTWGIEYPGNDAFSIDGTRFYFVSQTDSTSPLALYTTDVASGNTKLIVQPYKLLTFQLTADRQVIVYDTVTSTSNCEIFSISVQGGTSQRINGNLVEGGCVRSYQITPEQENVVYMANQEDAGLVELYRAPIQITPDIITPPTIHILEVRDSIRGVITPAGDTGTVEGNTLTARVKLTYNGTQPLESDLEIVDKLGNAVLARQTVVFQGTGEQDLQIKFNSQGLARDPQFGLTPFRNVYARLVRTNRVIARSADIDFSTKPRPVVLVHGWGADGTMWDAYTDTFLPSIGVNGLAVFLETGARLDRIGWSTNTIDQNARLLAEKIHDAASYVGAERVDVIAHSMGGLITRRYIEAYMSEKHPTINQLIMLGTPNLGSRIATALTLGSSGSDIQSNVLARVGWRYPASLELTPSYVESWNKQNSNHKGVPFYVVAGNYACSPFYSSWLKPLPIKLVQLPNDGVVWRESAFGIPLQGGWTYVSQTIASCRGYHNSLYDAGKPESGGQNIFDLYVKPLLWGTKPSLPSEIATAPLRTSSARSVLSVTETSNQDVEQEQFTNVQTSVLLPTKQLEFAQTVESSPKHTFIVYGNSSKMRVKLRAPNGTVYAPDTNQSNIEYAELDADLVPLTFYTVSNPTPGTWTTTVEPNQNTPADGVPVAAFGSLVSDLRMQAVAPTAEIPVNKSLPLTATIRNGTTAVLGAQVNAQFMVPGGTTTQITLYDDGQHADSAANDGIYGTSIFPTIPGIYSATISAKGQSGSNQFTRSTVWVTEAKGQSFFVPLVTRQ